MNNISVFDEMNSSLIDIEFLKDLAKKTLKYMDVENAIMNIIIVSTDKIHSINKEYRGIDRPTDVISFALEDDNTFIKTDYRVLGDIYICLDKVVEQAKEYGHSFKREISFLTVHGILHLLGYDHMNKDDERIMFGLQEAILNEFGIQR